MLFQDYLLVLLAAVYIVIAYCYIALLPCLLAALYAIDELFGAEYCPIPVFV